jgi:hypothetical protein
MDPVFHLKILFQAEKDFFERDRDGNGIPDYWVGDVAGLRTLLDKNGFPVELIDMSDAWRDASPMTKDSDKTRFAPLKECTGVKQYALQVIPSKADGSAYGEDIDLDGLKCKSRIGFAFCAVPAYYTKNASLTYIIDQTGVVWARDTGGVAIQKFPRDPNAEGWARK